MKLQNKLLVLDFDGVLCDSVGECCIVTARLLSRMYPDDHFPKPKTLAEVDPSFRDHFFAHRLLVGPGADFETVAEAWRRGITAHTREELEALVTEYDNERPRDPNAFYNERNYYRDEDMDGWLALHDLYPGTPEAVRRFQERLPVFVVSNKDFRSLKLILENHGVRIPDDALFGKEVGLHKFPTIQKIAAEHRTPLTDMYYVDDHLGHLMQPHAAGVRCYHADWGYTTDRDRSMARELGIRSLQLEDFGPEMLNH